MSSKMAIFVDNGISGASHAVGLRKVMLKDDDFSDANFVTLSNSSLMVTLISLVTLVVKYRFLPSLISAKYLNAAKSVANSRVDILYIDTLHLAFLCRRIGFNRCIVNFHNYDPDYLLELARLEKSLLRSWAYRYESFISKRILRKLERIERLEMWAITSRDFDSVKDLLADTKNLKIVPHQLPAFGSTKVCEPFISSGPNFDLVFIGSGAHGPNKEALGFIVDILACDARFVVHIVGPAWKIEPHSRLKFHGFVKDLDAFLASKSLFICPVFSGSGINMKIFTAMQFGLPGVLSRFTRDPFDVYGEDFPDHEYVVVNGKDARAWSDAIVARFELLTGDY